jgi:hypothetical protein
MANPFYIEPTNPLQALMMGQQGYAQGQKAVQDMALREAGQLFSRGDVAGAQAAAARGGSLQALMGFSNLANNDRNFSFRQQEAQRAQGNSDRSFKLQERQIAQSAAAQAAALALQRQQLAWQQEQGNRPEIREVTDASGNKSLVLVDRKANSARPIDTGVSVTPTNPYAAGGKFNEGQGKAATYADRMAASHNIITGLEGINEFDNPQGGYLGGQLEKIVPSAIFNTMAGADRQKFMQAKRDFVNATLRRESGAVINPDEFRNADQQYFPQPGDTPQVIEQKRQNRITTMQGIMREAGPGYRPPQFASGSNPQQKTQSSVTATPQAQQFSEGMTATNPKTGQRIVFRGGQWVPAQ